MMKRFLTILLAVSLFLPQVHNFIPHHHHHIVQFADSVGVQTYHHSDSDKANASDCELAADHTTLDHSEVLADQLRSQNRSDLFPAALLSSCTIHLQFFANEAAPVRLHLLETSYSTVPSGERSSRAPPVV